MITDSGYEGFHQTRGGLVLIQSGISIRGKEIVFVGLSFYPVTGTDMDLDVGDGVRIFHTMMDEARELGFDFCTVEAFRTFGATPGRMLVLTRRLR